MLLEVKKKDVSGSPAPVLPVDKVIALIDLLGDQVIDAQEAYEVYADTDLIANNNIGAKRIPSATTVPFLSYTDFLACLVAFLASLHSLT
ncbi:Hypothetical protein PHPALM_15338 [Phytophthora palmivora]|uniref:Uncharacterized protein n=1 Tax=Phytophthora palmivora TaxID=4796 RepID=A0A2P4XSM7_9STRA|nr:Hypothetical protein PHPALM_15338 [Phytophthora palmivora]